MPRWRTIQDVEREAQEAAEEQRRRKVAEREIRAARREGEHPWQDAAGGEGPAAETGRGNDTGTSRSSRRGEGRTDTPSAASRASRQSRNSLVQPSTAPSQHPNVLWGAFHSDDHPYQQQHVRTLLSIFYRIPTGEEGLDHLGSHHRQFLDQLPTSFPINILAKSGGRKRLSSKSLAAFDQYHKPFFIMAQAVLLAAARTRGWGLWEAYKSRCTEGREGYYRSKKWPSWRVLGEGEMGTSSIASEVSPYSQIRG